MSVSGLPSSLSCFGSSSSSYSSGLSQSVSLGPHSLCYTYEPSASVKLEPRAYIKGEREEGIKGEEREGRERGERENICTCT